MPAAEVVLGVQRRDPVGLVQDRRPRPAGSRQSSQDSARGGVTRPATASEAAHRAADKAMQILASKGYRHGSVVERLFRDVRATEIYQGTSEVQRMVIAEHILTG